MSIVKWMVSHWDDNPRLCEFVKETNHFYIKSNKSRESKISRYHDFFDTEQEAIDFIQSRKQRKEENKRLERIQDAAPDLLDALEDAVNRLTSSLILLKCDDDFIKKEIAKARAAIAKATA
ncbi:hypothetical protein [Pseudomonas aeruginosa]|uniref:hypothetical protein n=1 Tax=Pseudomonas aeruginosa TaxID=287 RepID=UPI00053E7387|nr:hypothetical protein [Pseudomonas aeruginosa]